MQFRRWLIQALVLFLALIPTLPARAAEPGRTQWKLSNFTWVKRVPSEPGAPANEHPAKLSETALLGALGAVQFQAEGADAPLFTPEELGPLAKALHEAFANAQPSEDLILLSTQRRGGHFMDPALSVTARLFVRGGALNLMVHDARLDFMDRYSADRTLPTFVYGSRKAPASVSLQAEGATRLRPDWLALPLSGAAARPAAVSASAPAAALPASVSAPAPVPAPSASPAGGHPRDEAFYEAQSLRLKALKRMRDENLISEAEYQEKRQEILKTL